MGIFIWQYHHCPFLLKTIYINKTEIIKDLWSAKDNIPKVAVRGADGETGSENEGQGDRDLEDENQGDLGDAGVQDLVYIFDFYI